MRNLLTFALAIFISMQPWSPTLPSLSTNSASGNITNGTRTPDGTEFTKYSRVASNLLAAVSFQFISLGDSQAKNGYLPINPNQANFQDLSSAPIASDLPTSNKIYLPLIINLSSVNAEGTHVPNVTNTPKKTATKTFTPSKTNTRNPTTTRTPVPTKTNTPNVTATRTSTPTMINTSVVTPTSTNVNSSIPAFLGAEGFGKASKGGSGGRVYEVTNTNDSGAGSLRSCVEASGARTCVFKVGGLISLNSPLTIANPYITIAGQTAPGGGITIKLGTATDVFLTETHDVIIRFITVRPGPGGENHGNQIASNGVAIYNVMIDHNTYSWGVDSNIETWYRVYNSTIQWSLISEGLNNSTHSKGAHSKGLMIGGYAGSESGNTPGSEKISVLNNLMASNVDRNPLIQDCGITQVINNVTYNATTTFSHQQLNCVAGTSYVNWINNYHKKGTGGAQTDLKIIPSDGGVCSAGKVYMSGNVGNNGSWSYDFSGTCSALSSSIITSVPASAPAVNTTNANDAYTNVLADAGNSRGLNCDGTWYPRRDAIDTRIINDVINSTGNIIDDPSQVGGWIIPAAGTGCSDSDHDGMPDIWELAHGLDSNNANDGSQIAPSGFTNLDEYLNGNG